MHDMKIKLFLSVVCSTIRKNSSKYNFSNKRHIRKFNTMFSLAPMISKCYFYLACAFKAEFGSTSVKLSASFDLTRILMGAGESCSLAFSSSVEGISV